MTLNINAGVNEMKDVIFMVSLSWLKQQLSLQAGSTARFLASGLPPLLVVSTGAHLTCW